MRNQDPNDMGQGRISLGWLILACLLVFLAWLFYPNVILDSWLGIEESQHTSDSISSIKGMFGDRFGGLSALFSGLAFAGIIYTILLQRSDLISTRQEVAKQNRNSEKQVFENTLFQMLFFRQEMLRDLEIFGDKGRKALENFFQIVVSSDPDFSVFMAVKSLTKEEVREINRDNGLVNSHLPGLSEGQKSILIESFECRASALDTFLDSDIGEHLKKLESASKKAVEEYMDELSHFLRYTFWIYKNINESSVLNESDRKNYADIVRSQLSDVEVATIFYSVIASGDCESWSSEPISIDEMRVLAKKFKIVGSLNDRFLIHTYHKNILEK